MTTYSRSSEDNAVMIDRDDISNYNTEHIFPESPENITKIRKWLQATNYAHEGGEFRKHLASHMSGTSTWLKSNDTFREWLDSHENGMLWIKGIPGPGKSVVAARLSGSGSRVQSSVTEATERALPSVEGPLRQAKVLRLRLEENEVDMDISSYVEHGLKASGIPIYEHDVIREAIPGRANGIFLYAKLAMDAFLEPGASTEEVLRTLPTDLHEMYTSLLHEHSIRSGVPPSVANRPYYGGSTATVTADPKQSYWVQSLEEEKGTTFSVLLRLLQKKREERKARTQGPVKDIWVDFDLYVAPASAPASNIPIRGIGNQFGSGQTPTERMLNQLPTVQAQLLATEGHASDVIIHWKCTHRGCRNHPLTCWVALKDGEVLPGRVENHYTVPHRILERWNMEIRQGVSSVLDPSENVQSLLRQEKERARGGKKDGTVSVLSEEIAGVKELLLRISQAYAAKGAAELAANIPKSEYAPFGSQYPPFRLLQAFFQWWYNQTPKHNTTMQAEITYLGNLAVRADWSLDFICNPCKISLQLWREVTMSCSLKRLYQMQTQIEQFVEDKHWETYINKETGWNQADFEPEILRQLAAEAEDLLALGIE
ncbi:hypothetical protein EJ02DRAFT_509704 [Clathrospora elynae]|uniref:Nephrocystin 3-like N-terminal domain-containing protein n=1 Tax=Clathrospora elynae TaxID=706981 RepID=A0A6A5SZW8_9PLEO|nr:hypothetical protein EJ02DRAFT_509704 [Clathrospora elynae]